MGRATAEALELVKQLVQLPENSVCADCKKRSSRWGSTNLGVFVCLECSGIHRSLGVHISFIRSCEMDSWTNEQAQTMKRIGNRRANDYYEARLDKGFSPPYDNRIAMEAFVRAKYATKQWASGDVPGRIGMPPVPSQKSSAQQHPHYEGIFREPQPNVILGQTKIMVKSVSQDHGLSRRSFFGKHSDGKKPAASGDGGALRLDDFEGQMRARSSADEGGPERKEVEEEDVAVPAVVEASPILESAGATADAVEVPSVPPPWLIARGGGAGEEAAVGDAEGERRTEAVVDEAAPVLAAASNGGLGEKEGEGACGVGAGADAVVPPEGECASTEGGVGEAARAGVPARQVWQPKDAWQGSRVEQPHAPERGGCTALDILKQGDKKKKGAARFAKRSGG